MNVINECKSLLYVRDSENVHRCVRTVTNVCGRSNVLCYCTIRAGKAYNAHVGSVVERNGVFKLLAGTAVCCKVNEEALYREHVGNDGSVIVVCIKQFLVDEHIFSITVVTVAGQTVQRRCVVSGVTAAEVKNFLGNVLIEYVTRATFSKIGRKIGKNAAFTVVDRLQILQSIRIKLTAALGNEENVKLIVKCICVNNFVGLFGFANICDERIIGNNFSILKYGTVFVSNDSLLKNFFVFGFGI